jgi:outer membrane protein assembly factor BamB
VAAVNAPTELAPDEPAFIGSEIGTDDGQVVAVDASDGSILWDTVIPGDPFGGVAVVNDLVLTTNYEGVLLALDRTSGEIVAEHALPGGVNSWLSVVGDLVLIPVGLGSPQLVALRLGV